MLGKRRIRTRVDRVKKHTLRHLRHVSKIDIQQTYFFIVNYLNHMLVGGASVNSLCQQGGLFALSVVVNFYLLKCRKLRREDQETSGCIFSRILY